VLAWGVRKGGERACPRAWCRWSPMPNTVHDALFKATFSNVEHAAGELRRLLPPAIVERINWSTLTLCPGSFVDEKLEQSHTDLLFSAEIAGHTAYLYVLFEHQSTVDALMPLRLLRYMVRVWDKLLANAPDAKKIPAILPVVLHHSDKGWTASTAFEALLDVDEDALAVIGAHVPRFSFWLDDISHESDDALRARAMSAIGRLSLFCLRHARSPVEILEGIRAWVGLIREARRAPNGFAALAVIWEYIFVVTRPYKEEEVLAMLIEAVGEAEGKEIGSVADQLIEKGRKKGQQEGRQEGAREMLLKLLGARFGALPEAVVARVMAAAAAELDLWFDRGLSAKSLAEVLGET